MKGIVIKEPGKISIETDIPEPQMGPYDALVETVACGICNGTDLKLIDGHFKGFSTYPCVLGHEPVGKVLKTGEKVKTYKIGDLVLRSMLVDTEKYYSGWGSFAERGLVSDYQAMIDDGMKDVFTGHMAQQIVPEGIDPEKAVMIITFKEVLSGLKRFGVKPDMSIMVNGAGPVGLSMIRLLKIMGVKKIIVSDIDKKRLNKAKDLGADIIVNPSEIDVYETVKTEEPAGLDIFIDAVGIKALMNLGLKLIKFNGKVAVYGIAPTFDATIDWEAAPYNWDIHFVQWPTFEEESEVHDEIIGYIKDGRLNLDDFVTHVLPIEDYEKGIDLVKSKEALKVSLTINK